jgi:regulator of RNase E activity RraA
MDHHMVQQRFAALTTAHLADACIRAQVPVRCASALLRAVVPGSRLAGRVCPARHAGSVDAFLEAFETAAPGDVLVVDNGGLLDEACVGDLVALEAHAAGMEGMVIWGLHRDTADIRAIGLPVFSLGAIPTGPLRLDARPPGALESAVVGDCSVTRDDLVLGDDDGVLFVPSRQAEEIVTLAETIRDTERRQAERIRAGVSLRSQVRFSDYLAKRGQTPALSFREHLRAVGGAIEE